MNPAYSALRSDQLDCVEHGRSISPLFVVEDGTLFRFSCKEPGLMGLLGSCMMAGYMGIPPRLIFMTITLMVREARFASLNQGSHNRIIHVTQLHVVFRQGTIYITT